LPVISEIPEDLHAVVFSPGGPLQAVPHERLLSKLIATNLCKATKALLDADLVHAADSVALVFSDPSAMANGWYRKVGEEGAGSWEQFEELARNSRIIAQASASAAADTLTAVNSAGATQLDAVNTAGATQLAAVTAEGDEQVALVNANALAYARASQTLRSGTSTLALLAGSTLISVGSNVTGFARAFLCGTDFPSGSNIDAVRLYGEAPVMVVTVFERAPDAPSLNAVPGSSGDVIVATSTITSAAYRAAGYCAPVPRYPGKPGFYYIPAVETFAADGVTRAAAEMRYSTASDGPQWQEGWIRSGSSAWSNYTNTRYLAVGLVTSPATVDVGAVTVQARATRVSDQTADYRAMVLRNLEALRNDCAFDPLGTGLTYRLSGDSLAQQTSGSPLRTSTTVLTALAAGVTASNIGFGGDTTGQILTRINNDNIANPSRAAGTNISNGSNNDENALAYSVTRANCDSIIATFTGQWAFAVGGSEPGPSPKQQRLFEELRAVHGARIYDWETIWRQNENLAADARLTGDGTHPNTLGTTLLGYEQTRLFRAMNGGAPYVHEEVLPLRVRDAAGTSISSGLVLGTVTQAYRSGGDNSDAAVAIAPATGAITRGAGEISPAILGSREIIVRAQNYRGGHEGRKTLLLAQDTGDTLPRYDVEFLGTSDYQIVPLRPVDSAASGTTAVLADTTRISFVMFMRVTRGLSGALAGPSNEIVDAATRFSPRARFRDTANVGLGGLPVWALPADPFAMNAYFVSIDKVAGVMTIATNETSQSIAIASNSVPVRMSGFRHLFASTGSPWAGCAMRRLMVFTGHAFDFTDAAKRELFYDPETFLPIDTGGATIDGQTAIIDIYGREFDWNRGINRGSLGNLLPARWNGLANMAVREIF
jgi:hypothetical protein